MLPAPASAGAVEGTFSVYVSCRPLGTHPASVCPASSRPSAVLIATDRDQVDYRVCVRRPSKRSHCRGRTTQAAGTPSRTPIELGRPGRYRIGWRVAGSLVGRRVLHVPRPRVFVNGDSLAVGTKPYLPQFLGGWTVHQSTSISRHAPQGVSLLAHRRHLERIVVMSLGTNDDPHAVSSFDHAVRKALRIVGPRRCIVWPTIVRPRVGGASYAGYNQVLTTLEGKRQNLIAVNWARIIRHHHITLASDGVHPDARGYRIRARALANAARRCLDAVSA